MNKAYLGLGTNMGDRLDYISSACEILSNNNNIEITNKSKLYETKAWGYTDQADFLNLCLEIETSLDEYGLLKVCQEVEKKLNRERIIRWGPRTIDVDILFFNDIILNNENLSLPHPRISERAFVLIPLMDLNQNLFIKGKVISEYLNSLTNEERDEVKEYIGDEKKPI
ncbi:2-amino-4-hydroxy-6-hydroxymethyldihydropteridine diphosphokinase [Clostridium sp. CCUG 7971]|uniref:2-amino-4-hydroxy-6- hydroxymethyldihydropteridine diphosphokinase n=1 Tax=Clostridium sp. CCUG 7971 TaxID=2811414 RepID=UPI001ABA9BCD|nr:2-amino-4-hydroxy-6-hydroxymethyldihydropteridine diphosphokinase [Clostridium sp. CCUG 7971]MBO3445007.1 2-amino-4-hydroxy-6-hydroxymethyldihydropteridine diphosphokinase [Clostridium sp. CCUG 7971]